MRLINFYFTLDQTFLDQTFKEGLDHRVCKREREEGKNVDCWYNPNPTSIYLSWSIGGKYFKCPVGQSIRPVDWDWRLKLPVRKHRNYLELSVLLKTIKSKTEREYLNARTNNEAITPETIRTMVIRIINGNHSIADEGKFWEAYDEFITEKSYLVKPSTIAKYRSLRKTLEGFEKAKYPMTFEAVTMKWYTDFLIYSIGLGKVNSSINKDIRQLKGFQNWAYERNYTRSIEHKKFRCQEDYSDPIFLTLDELAQIERYDASASASKALSKDIFLFLCYTGQRISDVALLKKKHIRASTCGPGMEWELYQEKGNKQRAVHIYLIDKARKILDKYLADKGDDDFIFPRQSSVIINRNLKKIGKSAGLCELLTKVNFSGKAKRETTMPKFFFLSSHVARRTCVSLLSSINMPDHEIQSVTGHASSKEMKPYRGIFRQNVREGLIRAFEQKEAV